MKPNSSHAMTFRKSLLKSETVSSVSRIVTGNFLIFIKRHIEVRNEYWARRETRCRAYVPR